MKKILIFLLFASFSFSQNWWNNEWKYRKKVEFDFDEKELPFEKVGVINFNGNCKENGEDIRVIDERGNEVEYFLVSSKKPKYQILIPLRGKIYYVYYGNEKAQKKDYNFSPKCGLILEVYERKDDKCNSWEEAIKTIEKSLREGILIGKGLWKKIWDGTNPFGYQKDVIKIYTGYFYIEKDGDYEFATSSSGASFLLIDDKIVAKWPGWHPARPFVTPEQSGKIYLSKGIHKITYYHISGYNYEISVAAVKFPGKENFEVIPESFFIPVFEGKITSCERLNGKMSFDFEWENINFLRRERWNLITYRFIFKNYDKREFVFLEWDFGDGQKKYGNDVFHTYIGEGIYNVELKIKDKDGNFEKINYPVEIVEDHSKIYLNPRTGEEYIKEFEDFNIKTLPDDKLKSLAEIFLSYERMESALNCYNELLKRKLDEKEKFDVGLIYAEISKKLGKFEEGEKIYKEILEKGFDIEIFLKLMDIYIELGKVDIAMKECQNILNNKDLKEEYRRKIELKIADALRFKGEKEKAKEIYKKYTDDTLYRLKDYSYSQSVLYYIKNNDFSTAIELLEKWADEIPVCKIEGRWSVLKTRCFIIKKDYENALKEIETFIKIAEKDNIYLPFALYLAFEICEKLNLVEKGNKYKERLIKEFPEKEYLKDIK